MYKYGVKSKMRAVTLIQKDVELITFMSLQERSRWLDENTNYKGKNKASKIKAAADGERKSAFDFSFKYSKEV